MKCHVCHDDYAEEYESHVKRSLVTWISCYTPDQSIKDEEYDTYTVLYYC